MRRRGTLDLQHSSKRLNNSSLFPPAMTPAPRQTIDGENIIESGDTMFIRRQGINLSERVDIKSDITISPSEQEAAEILEETEQIWSGPCTNLFGVPIHIAEVEDYDELFMGPPLETDEPSGNANASTPKEFKSLNVISTYPQKPEFIDSSKIVEEAKGTAEVDEFLLALGLFATSLDISTTQYSAMVELFEFLNRDPSLITKIPRSLSTLKKYMRSVLPIQTIKAHTFVPESECLPPQSKTPASAYYFDLKEYAALWQSDSKIMSNLHTGFGEFVDVYSELWHGDAWLESVRTSSGEFAKLSSGQVIVPSDCVYYTHPKYPHLGPIFLGRISGIGTDKRSSGTGNLSAAITPLVPAIDIKTPWKDLYYQNRSNLLAGTVCEHHEKGNLFRDSTEVILMEHQCEIIPISLISKVESVFFLDYKDFAECRPLLPSHPPVSMLHVLHIPRLLLLVLYLV
ncbi:hypothetical protein BDZ91DRAFT_699236 [Kalaharituber pfeilii]|nr:hypothetical protein BDZ91DRAFT_699236 [Kalaharituber pfeilii]